MLYRWRESARERERKSLMHIRRAWQREIPRKNRQLNSRAGSPGAALHDWLCHSLKRCWRCSLWPMPPRCTTLAVISTSTGLAEVPRTLHQPPDSALLGRWPCQKAGWFGCGWVNVWQLWAEPFLLLPQPGQWKGEARWSSFTEAAGRHERGYPGGELRLFSPSLIALCHSTCKM